MKLSKPLRSVDQDREQLAARPRAAAWTASVLLGLALLSPPAHAAVGDLDPSFGTNGLQAADFDRGPSAAKDVAVQSDGKIVAIGSASGRVGEFAAARYSSDGTLDATFDGDGRRSDVFPGGQANAVAIQANGKIVVAGRSDGSPALVRYNADGSLDSSFSGDGKLVLTDLNNGSGATDVAVQADGKIVLSGTFASGGSANANMGLVRLDSDGSYDTTFAGDGSATTSLSSSDTANALALQSDGKIVVAGSSTSNIAVLRYNADGSLDTSFSDDGQETLDLGGNENARAVAVQADGKIVVVSPGGQYGASIAVVRFTSAGAVDTTFGSNGVETAFVGDPRSVLVQASGKIVVVGGGSGGDFVLTRYTATGSPDGSFSGDGKQVVDFGSAGTGVASAAVQQSDGKIVVAGVSGARDGSDFALARANTDGAPDTAFSSDGQQTTAFPGFDEANAAAVQSDGKIVVAGSAGVGHSLGGGDFAVARFNSDGTPDTSFSGDGRLTTDFGGYADSARSLALQPDGKIVVAGDNGSGDIAIARYTSDGSLDSTFSGDGKQIVDLGDYSVDGARSVAVQADGKIVVAGAATNQFALTRLTAAGELDATFSGDGKLTTTFGTATSGVAVGVKVQPDGKIVAAGSAGFGSAGSFGYVAARYLADGSLDPTFARDGKQETNFDNPSGSVADALALQADGKIVLAGHDGVGGYGAWRVVRFTAAGLPDSTFGSGGRVSVSIGQTGRDVSGVAVRADGTITVVGTSGLYTDPDFAIARLMPDGTFDSRFGDGGQRTSDFGGVDRAGAVALQSDGSVVVAGSVTRASVDFAAVRYLGGPVLANVDTVPPSIQIASPAEGQHFTKGQIVASNFSCSDGAGSGVATCQGPPAVDTSVVGSRTFTVAATDYAGLTSTNSVSYVVDDVPAAISVPAPAGNSAAQPSPDTPSVQKPAAPVLIPTPAPASKKAPTIRLKGGTLKLSEFELKPAKAGKCPKTVSLVVSAGKAKLAKKVKVSKNASGVCVVSATINLTGKLAKVRTVVVNLTGKGVTSVKHSVARSNP